jgi:hypothetical protein
VLDAFQDMEKKIDELELDRIWELKPLLDGSSLMTMMQLPKGPIIGKVMEEQMLWQIHTRSMDTEACLSHLKTVFKTLVST